MLNPAGQLEWVRDAKGEVVRSRLDEKSLTAIAAATGGNYYPLGPLGEGLAKVRAAVETLDRAEGLQTRATAGVLTAFIGRWRWRWRYWPPSR